MKPSVKSEAIETAIQDILGHDRREAIYQNKCVPKPIGCGNEVVPELWDALTQKEFSISGLCADCQDSFFDQKSNQFPTKPERQFYVPTANDYVIQRQPMRSGQGEAQSRRYHKYVSKSGKVWLVADQPNAGANVYVEGGPNSDGFGGATLTFPLVDGSEIKLKGPWHTNAGALYSDTGVDVRNQHYTFVVVSRRRESGEHYEMIMADVLYKDEASVLGSFDRGKGIARKLLSEMALDSVALYSESEGGSSCGFEYAEGKEPRHCKQCMSWHPESEHKAA
jgi:hypothetical protein